VGRNGYTHCNLDYNDQPIAPQDKKEKVSNETVCAVAVLQNRMTPVDYLGQLNDMLCEVYYALTFFAALFSPLSVFKPPMEYKKRS